MKKQYLFLIIQWSLAITTILFIISGFGITNYQVISLITFGIITKPFALQLHTLLIYPFLILFFLHILLSEIKRHRRKKHAK